jgi:hypothetical protein
LAIAQKVTFCVAVGNDGDAGPGLDRIQTPADLANGLGVGAFSNRGNGPVRAPYSCIGPGRECAKIKPDLVAFGGCEIAPIHLVSVTHGEKILARGTSFACPQVASISAECTEAVDRGTALLARALVVHSADHPGDGPDHFLGHGMLQPNLGDILACDSKKVTVVFQGSITPTQFIKLPLLLPAGVVTAGTVDIAWTIACLPNVNPSHPSDYTSCCIEDTFYPHSNVFVFSKRAPSGKMQFQRVDENSDAATATSLLASGWKKSALPAPFSGNLYPTEHLSRELEYKWEPIVHKGARKRASSLSDPFLVLHAIARNGETAAFDYSAIVTLDVPKFSGDLYDIIRRRFTTLQPVRLRDASEIRIPI